MCLLSREVPILGIKNAAVTKKKKTQHYFPIIRVNERKQAENRLKSINIFKYVTNL